MGTNFYYKVCFLGVFLLQNGYFLQKNVLFFICLLFVCLFFCCCWVLFVGFFFNTKWVVCYKVGPNIREYMKFRLEK